MKLILSNEEVDVIIAALRSNGHPKMYELSDRIEAEAHDKCLEAEDGEHTMIQPEDSHTIKWNDHGVCRDCGTIRRLT